MGDHPVFRYPVFRERCFPSGRRGLPVGGAGFLVSPKPRVKRKVVPLSRGSARPRGLGGGRRPRLGDLGAFRCLGPPKALSSDSLDPRRPRPPKRSCSSRGVDATDPWLGSKRFRGESSKSPPSREFERIGAIARHGAGLRKGLRRGRKAGIGSPLGEILLARGTAIARHGAQSWRGLWIERDAPARCAPCTRDRSPDITAAPAPPGYRRGARRARRRHPRAAARAGRAA